MSITTKPEDGREIEKTDKGHSQVSKGGEKKYASLTSPTTNVTMMERQGGARTNPPPDKGSGKGWFQKKYEIVQEGIIKGCEVARDGGRKKKKKKKKKSRQEILMGGEMGGRAGGTTNSLIY